MNHDAPFANLRDPAARRAFLARNPELAAALATEFREASDRVSLTSVKGAIIGCLMIMGAARISDVNRPELLFWGHLAMAGALVAVLAAAGRLPRTAQALGAAAGAALVALHAVNVAIAARTVPLPPTVVNAVIVLCLVMSFAVIGFPFHEPRRLGGYVALLLAILFAAVIQLPRGLMTMTLAVTMTAGVVAMRIVTVRILYDAMLMRGVAEMFGERLRKDLELGRKIQKHLLPERRVGTVAGWDFRIILQPFGLMSGDWCQMWTGTDQRGMPIAALAIGDGMGKGASAALPTAVITSTWRGLERRWLEGEPVDPEEIVAELDEALRVSFSGAQNSTLSLAVLRPEDARLVSIAAPPWLRIAPSHAVAKLKRQPRNPLGEAFLDTIEPLLVETIVPRPGEALVAVTDGLAETGSAVRRLMAELGVAAAGGAADELDQRIAALAPRVAAEQVLEDDYTVLIIRRRPG